MNNVTQESKDSVMKTMAVVGFVAVIIFAVWLAVQIVQLIPGAFTSLASIADGVYGNRPVAEFTVASNESVVNTGEDFTLSWTNVNQNGTYSFMYKCTDGVSVDIRNNAGEIVSIACDTPLGLGTEVTSLEIAAASEKKRFTDVGYTVAFRPNGAADVAASQSGKFTVVNPSIPQSVAVADDTDESEGEVAGETTSTESEEDTVDPAPVVSTPAPTVIETPIIAIPTSDPNGFTDLEVRFLGVGTMDNNNRFTQTATIDNDRRGAYQFEVKNTGTKTSTAWEYAAILTSGTEYESGRQDPLKPNERSVITLGFDAVGETGVQFFGATVSGGSDRNRNNNSFTWAVEVTN